MASYGKNYFHNKAVYDRLKVGDRVRFNRGLYKHWGIYIGLGQIVHLAGEDDDGIDANVNSTHMFSIGGKLYKKASVCINDFWEVAGDDEAYIDNDRDSTWGAFDPSEIVRNAKQKIGQVGYNLIYANCEHFVNWCRYGKSKSDQVDNFLTGLAVAGAAALSVGAIVAISKWAESSKTEKNKK